MTGVLGGVTWFSLYKLPDLRYDTGVMAKRRTKEDKKKAQEHHQSGVTYSYAETEAPSSGETSSVSTGPSRQQLTSSLYPYDTALIRSDLVKTVIVSLAILIIELAIYYVS